jgi:hypothetical protein
VAAGTGQTGGGVSLARAWSCEVQKPTGSGLLSVLPHSGRKITCSLSALRLVLALQQENGVWCWLCL